MDKFSEYPTSLTAPAREAAAVTPSDTVDLPFLSRALYVGGTGTIVVRMAGGGSVTFANAQAGSFLPIRAQGISATGTTATGLVAVW